MPNVLIRDVPEEALEVLRAQAKRDGRSLQSELRRIIEAEAESRRNRLDFARRAAVWREVNGPQTTDRTDLIREDRDTDYGRDE